jgi:hypothetical protein
MNGFNHDMLCESCCDTGLVVDERSADEDGAYDLLFCTRCQKGEELADQSFRDTLQLPETHGVSE